MKILLTEVNGYIGKRLFPVFIEQGHISLMFRDISRFPNKEIYKLPNVFLFEVNF